MALQFLDLLTTLRNNPHALFDEARPAAIERDRTFRFSTITIIAHSLGAVIARQALVDAHHNAYDWTSETSLFLFAPAHLGADIASLIDEVFVFAPVIVSIGGLLKLKYPVLYDIEPGCDTLVRLEQQTKSYIDKEGAADLVPHSVVLAQYDNVINPNQFAYDPTPLQIPDTKHSTVCKPTANKLDSLNAVMALL